MEVPFWIAAGGLAGLWAALAGFQCEQRYQADELRKGRVGSEPQPGGAFTGEKASRAGAQEEETLLRTTVALREQSPKRMPGDSVGSEGRRRIRGDRVGW